RFAGGWWRASGAPGGPRCDCGAGGGGRSDLSPGRGGGVGVVRWALRTPGRGGPATLAALRGLDPGVRCCFMSGDLGDHTAEELVALGACHLFSKPLNLRELAETLRRVASGRA